MQNPNSAGYGSKLTPFRAIAADADFVTIIPSGFGPTGPVYTVTFGKYTPEVHAIPGTPEVPQKSGPNLPDYQPAIPATPDTPAVPAQFRPQRSEALTLTQDEWDNWDKSMTDEAYILQIAASRFGVTLVST